MDSSFCRRLPKLELHAHLNGSLSEKTLKELNDYYLKNNIHQAKPIDCSVFQKESCSLNEFFEIFKVTHALTSTPKTVQMATERVIEDFCNDNVIYLELRSTLRKENQMTKRNYLESMIKGVLDCKQKFPNISVKLIISINRSEPIESARENVDLSIEYLKKYPDIIVGIDTSGNPTTSNFKSYVEILKLARNEGLKITVHCGEVKGDDEVRDILNFRPDRIGHGTCIHQSLGGCEENWKELLEKKIPVELCITSNLKCHTVDKLDNHHFKLLFAANHPLTLATDDKGVFGSILSEEFEITQRAFELSDEELWKLSYNTIDYIFASENEKESLRLILNQWKIGNM